MIKLVVNSTVLNLRVISHYSPHCERADQKMPKKAPITEEPSQLAACFMCKKTRKTINDVCKPCLNRLKTIMDQESCPVDRVIAMALRTGRVDRRVALVEKWAQTVCNAIDEPKSVSVQLKR